MSRIKIFHEDWKKGFISREAFNVIEKRIQLQKNEILIKLRKDNSQANIDFKIILNLIANNKISDGITLLFKQFKNNKKIVDKLVIISASFTLIKAGIYEKGILTYLEFEAAYNQNVELLLLLLKNIQENGLNIDDDIIFIKKLLSKWDIDSAILLFQDFLITHWHDQCEEWYLLEMLAERNLIYRTQIALGGRDVSELRSEESKIVRGLMFILYDKINFNLINTNLEIYYNKLNFDNNEIEKIIQGMIMFLLSGETEIALKYLRYHLGNSHFIIMSLGNFKDIKRNSRWGFTQSYMSEVGALKRLNLIILRQLNSMMGFQNEKIDIGDNTSNITKLSEESKIDIIESIKTYILNNDLRKAFNLLLSINEDKETHLEILLQFNKYNQLEEDIHFTKKSSSLIEYRLNQVRYRLIEFLAPYDEKH